MAIKVLRIQSEKLVSAFSDCEDGGGLTVYTPYKWTRPNKGCGPLAAFKSMNDWQLAFSLIETRVAYKCRIVPSSYKLAQLFTNCDIKSKLPQGTILCNAIMITEPV